jgi:hypothetical protein
MDFFGAGARWLSLLSRREEQKKTKKREGNF